MENFRLDANDYECPYCYQQLEECIDEVQGLLRYCVNCGKSFKIEEELYND